jgi:ABC-2 type transport system permease protein
MILNIPTGFGREISSGKPVKIQVSVDAVNATSAQLSWSYLNAIVNDYNRELIGINQFTGQLPGISLIGTENRYWYNEMLNYKFYMLPGILGILVTAIGFLLAGLNMVREKEIGTIEQINVTPVRKHQFIIAKMIPFLIIGIIDLSVGLIIGKIFFGIPFVGSVLLLFLSSFLFLIAVLGLGLFISTLSSTQQQYMFSAFFFMIIFILMSGIFTPFDSMPAWAQKFDIINPVAYIIRIFRMVILKGSTFFDLRFDILSLSLIAVFFTAFAVFRYRKTA